jgi:hypothetical protein
MTTTLQAGREIHGKAFEIGRYPELVRVLRYDNRAVVARYVKEFSLSNREAELLFDDVKRFLWLNFVSGVIAPPPKIDEAWHIFIIFTKDYAEFCQTIFGRFMHHRPRRPEDPPNDGTTARRTIQAVGEHFGGFSKLSINWVISASNIRAEQCSSDGVQCAPEPSCSSSLN